MLVASIFLSLVVGTFAQLNMYITAPGTPAPGGMSGSIHSSNQNYGPGILGPSPYHQAPSGDIDARIRRAKEEDRNQKKEWDRKLKNLKTSEDIYYAKIEHNCISFRSPYIPIHLSCAEYAEEQKQYMIHLEESGNSIFCPRYLVEEKFCSIEQANFFKELRQKRIHRLEKSANEAYNTNYSKYNNNVDRAYILKLWTAAANITNEGRAAFAAGKYDQSIEFLHLAEKIIDVLTAYTPGISLVRDAYEALFGIDLITGRMLEPYERAFAFAGFLTGGTIKPIARDVLGSLKKLSTFQEVTHTKEFNEVVGYAMHFSYSKRLSELKDTISFFKRNKIYKPTAQTTIDVTNAFQKGAKTRVLTEDMKVYRYFDDLSEARGHWVTPKELDNHVEKLALPRSGPYQVKEWTIPKGTEILEGVAAPNFGKPGGGSQILVNKEILQ